MLKKLRSLILIAALLPAAAFADVTVEQAVEISNAISSLDQPCTKIIDGKPQQVPYQFSSTARWTLACDAAAVKPIAEAYDAVRKSVALGINPKGISPDDQAGQSAFSKAIAPIVGKTAMDDAEKPIVLQKVSLADLNLDANPIPTTVLVWLRPIIQP